MPDTPLAVAVKLSLCLMLFQCYLLQFIPPIQCGARRRGNSRRR
jgi:hypothetical protein